MNAKSHGTDDRGPPLEQPAPQQFSLRTLVGVVIALALLFGVLTWLGLKGSGALVAFATAGGTALVAILCIELFKRLRNFMRSGPRG